MSLIRNAVARLVKSSSRHPAPRRIVLLGDDDHGEPLEVLAEPPAAEVHKELVRLKEEGKQVAAEWWTGTEWRRWLWTGKRTASPSACGS